MRHDSTGREIVVSAERDSAILLIIHKIFPIKLELIRMRILVELYGALPFRKRAPVQARNEISQLLSTTTILDVLTQLIIDGELRAAYNAANVTNNRSG